MSRFCTESISDPSLNAKCFEDIPAIKELRRLHREAEKKQKISPRSSDEKEKWISWNECVHTLHDPLLLFYTDFIFRDSKCFQII